MSLIDRMTDTDLSDGTLFGSTTQKELASLRELVAMQNHAAEQQKAELTALWGFVDAAYAYDQAHEELLAHPAGRHGCDIVRDYDEARSAFRAGLAELRKGKV